MSRRKLSVGVVLLIAWPIACGGASSRGLTRDEGTVDAGMHDEAAGGENGGAANAAPANAGGARGGADSTGDGSDSGAMAGAAATGGGVTAGGAAGTASANDATGGGAAMDLDNSMDAGGSGNSGGVAGGSGVNVPVQNDGGAAGSGGAGGSNGAAGSGSEAPRPEWLPEHCEPSTVRDEAGRCALTGQCNGTWLDSLCEQDEAGAWQCRCTFGGRYRELELVSATGVESCAAAIGLCEAAELDPAEEETCVQVPGADDEDDCSLTGRCGREILSPLYPGIQARLMVRTWVGCSRTIGDWVVNCERDGTDGRYCLNDVVAADAREACPAYFDFCATGQAAVFDGPLACGGQEASVSADACTLSRVCGPTMELSSGAQLINLLPNSSSCTAGTEGSECSCERHGNSMQLTAAEDISEQLCADIAASCLDDAEFVADGDAQCENGTLEATEDWCYVVGGCQLNGTVNGRSATVENLLEAGCERDTDTSPWACGCDLADRSLELDPELDGLDACAVLPRLCSEHLLTLADP